MNSISRQIFLAGFCVITLSVPRLAAQVNSDGRDKTEKVAEVLAALEATSGKRIADVGSGDGFYAVRIARTVEFIPFTDPKHKGGFWLMIAVKPSRQF